MRVREIALLCVREICHYTLSLYRHYVMRDYITLCEGDLRGTRGGEQYNLA
jgi:hypothetical protein